MSATLEASDRARRWVIGTIVAYFGLLGYGILANEPLAQLLAYVLFGIIAIGIGTGLMLEGRADPIGAAGACFIAGGMAQFAWLATGVPALEAVSTIGVFAGIGLYIYATRMG